MNKLYAYFLLAVLLLAELPLKAAPVSEDSARTVAANVLGTTQLVNRTAELPSDIGQYMYLFSPEGGVGFVLISADDCALPVLGYSTTSTMNFAVEGFSSWLSHSKTQIANIRSQGLAASARVAALWTQLMDGGPVLTGASVAPMLTTAWGVDVLYRRFSPVTSSGYECHPGQIAVAMAQIMKYWNYPPRGLGSVSYTNTGDVAAQVTADFSTAYDWDNMPDVLTDASSDAEKDAVNEIIFHAGAAIQTIYRVNNSPMQGGNIYAAFRNNFRYNTQTVRTINTSSFTHAAYDEMMMAEITSGRPFLYRNGNVYYCFVVDGCDGWGQYHVNWGNAGSNNGYFALGSLNPEVYTYPWSVISVVGIEPLTLYAISVQSNNDEWGSVSGGGYHEMGNMVTLEATPIVGARFVQWNDGGTDNPRTFVANGDRTDVAEFEYVGIANVSATVNDAERGSVSGAGTYTIGDNVVLTAMPASGWIFERWNDGSTEATRQFTATEDVSFSAYFIRPGAGDPQFHLVELDDRENHAWSYYSDPECLVRSLNPMDVRIRYFGYGQNTMYSSDALQPEGEPDVDVSPYMVGIGIDAPWKNTYVYHKTLERVNGEQAESMAAADGPSFYRLIPNPYSRRPTHGTGDTRWRGFYKWRLKTLTGGSVYRDTAMTQPVSVGMMLDAEDTVFFMPAAEYGMEVDFEAIWARAVVFPNINGFYDTPAGEYVVGSNAYERNIIVHNCDTCFWRRNYNPPAREYTFTFVHPDGTNGINSELLTEVPRYSISGNRIVHSRSNPASSCKSLTPPTSFPIAPSEGKLNFYAGGLHPAFTTSGLMSPFGETAKLEYVRFSPHQTEVHHCFIHRDCAIPETDTTWMCVLTNIGQRNLFGDTLRGLKVYNGDTLYTKATLIVGLKNFHWSNGGGYLICGRMCLSEDGCNFFLAPRTMVGLHNSEVQRYPRDNYQIRWRLESGGFLSAIKPGGKDNNELYFMAQSITTLRGLVSVDVVIGNDYDRSLGDNSKLLIRAAKTGRRIDVSDSVGNHNTRMVNYVFKSGTFTEKYSGDSNEDDPYVMYFGPWYPTGFHGSTTALFEGGEFTGIAGGADNINSTGLGVDYNKEINNSLVKRRFYFKGGHVKHAVWGAADYGGAGGGRRMVFTGGKISGWIAGGTNGTKLQTAGALTGDVNIYFGGTATLQHDTVEDAPYFHSHGGNLYGAGVGRPDAMSQGWVYSSHVVVADSAYISRNVYGGGNYGFVSGFSENRRGSDIQILGGTVKGSVFGGANRARGNRVNVTMRGGHVHGSVYGGSNVKGDVTGPVTVRVEGGTVGTLDCDDSVGNVFGSGYGVESSVSGDVQVVIGRTDARRPHVNNPLIHGDVYGGGFAAPYISKARTFSVTTWNGRIMKSVYGGGLGSNATITGNTNVNVLGTTHVEGNVYGGGNMGKVTGDTRVVIGEDTGSYTLAVVSNNDAMGTVSGGGVFQAITDVRISAIPTASHRFKQWNDGNTQNPRTVTVEGDATYTAEFEPIPVYTITVAVADDQGTMGVVSGGGDYMEGQAVSIKATPIAGYRFVQWNDGNTENPRSITVVGDAIYTAEFEEIPVVWVDLGFPSGLLWAASNVGADNPEEYGDYYAWGETAIKRQFAWYTYIYCHRLESNMLKYCFSASYGYNGYTDNLTTLQPEDDAATAILGGGARIPTKAEWQELISNTTQANATVNGVAGRRFTSKKNGNSIFFPFAGYATGTNVVPSSSYIWTSTLGTSNANYAVSIYINNSSSSIRDGSRFFGYSIRAVRSGN